VELESFSGEVKIDRDGAMKGTENGIFVRIKKINSGETGERIVHTFYWGIKNGADDPDPTHIFDMGGVFLFHCVSGRGDRVPE
jgi:hypothetical protein